MLRLFYSLLFFVDPTIKYHKYFCMKGELRNISVIYYHSLLGKIKKSFSFPYTEIYKCNKKIKSNINSDAPFNNLISLAFIAGYFSLGHIVIRMLSFLGRIYGII